jgi:arginyl-tRNA synthetase
VRKSTGELTYAAADVAYMLDKVERGAQHLVMTLGHDHHSYAVRLDSMRRALGLENTALNVILYQLIKMRVDGEQVRMSKRAGNIVTLNDVIETVGKDVTRFFFLNRKADAQLEFDLNLALSKTEENPVYYIHYAYVRTNSIFAKADEIPALRNITIADSATMDNEDRILVRKIMDLKQIINGISTSMQTHLLSYYAIELAQLFHTYYGKNKIVDAENVTTSRGRLFTVQLTHEALKRVLTLLGLSLPEKM